MGGVSDAGVSEEGAAVAGISGSGKITSSSESRLEREENNIVHIKYSKGRARYNSHDKKGCQFHLENIS